MSLLPAIQLDIGNARYESQIAEVSVHLGPLPSVNRARITLPINAELDAANGTDASLSLDAGDGLELVLKGKVRGRTVSFSSQTVVIADGSADLAAYRPTTTFQAGEAAAVAKSLTGDVDVTMELPPAPFGLGYFAAHGRRTAAEHLAHLARLTGSLGVWTAEGGLRFLPLNPLVPLKAIRHGRDITQWQTYHAPRAAAEWVAVGHGPAGAVQAPNALLQSTGTLPSSPSEGGPGIVRQSHPLLRTPLTSQTTNNALNQLAQLGMVQAKAKAIPMPSLRPGLVLQVQELPKGNHPDSWLVSQVSHFWHPQRGAATHFHGWSTASAGGLLGQLGALL